MRPRIAFSAVLLPAPLGPIRPRMRPDSTLRSMPSRATVLPKLFLRPRASMQAMASNCPLFVRSGAAGCGGRQQFTRRQFEPADGSADIGPLRFEEFAAL